MVRCFAESSVADILPLLQVPTLLLHSREQHWLSPEEGTKLASRIAGAQIRFLDGDLEPDDVQSVRTMVSFLKDLARDESEEPPVASLMAPEHPLSTRQAEILKLIAAGKTTREIGHQLTLSERTIERHISDVYAKLGVRNRVEATAIFLNRP
jgi:DNA-binding CsgD family transcriptional regulator